MHVHGTPHPQNKYGFWEACFHRTHLHHTMNRILSKPWDLEEPQNPTLYYSGFHLGPCLWKGNTLLPSCSSSLTHSLLNVIGLSLTFPHQVVWPKSLRNHWQGLYLPITHRCAWKMAQKAKVLCVQKVVVNSQEQIIVAFWDHWQICIASVLFCSTLRNFVSLRSLTWAKREWIASPNTVIWNQNELEVFRIGKCMS